MTEETDSFSLDLENERIQRELDEEKKKRKERQRIVDDIGVMVAMVTITFFAVLVVVIKVIILHTEVENIEGGVEISKLNLSGSHLGDHISTNGADEIVQDKIYRDWIHCMQRVNTPHPIDHTPHTTQRITHISHVY